MSIVRALLRRIPGKWRTRPCRPGCTEPSVHNAHLSFAGRLWLKGYYR